MDAAFAHSTLAISHSFSSFPLTFSIYRILHLIVLALFTLTSLILAAVILPTLTPPSPILTTNICIIPASHFFSAVFALVRTYPRTRRLIPWPAPPTVAFELALEIPALAFSILVALLTLVVEPQPTATPTAVSAFLALRTLLWAATVVHFLYAAVILVLALRADAGVWRRDIAAMPSPFTAPAGREEGPGGEEPKDGLQHV